MLKYVVIGSTFLRNRSQIRRAIRREFARHEQAVLYYEKLRDRFIDQKFAGRIDYYDLEFHTISGRE